MVLKIGLVLFIIGIILVIAGAVVTIKANKYELKIGGIITNGVGKFLMLIGSIMVSASYVIPFLLQHPHL